jgi:hypothetical protein
MSKKIAVLVRDRKQEALRLAVGATLLNDEVSVFITDEKLETDEEISVNLEMLEGLKVKIYSNNPDNKFEQKSTKEIAGMLTEYDVVIAY